MALVPKSKNYFYCENQIEHVSSILVKGINSLRGKKDNKQCKTDYLDWDHIILVLYSHRHRLKHFLQKNNSFRPLIIFENNVSFKFFSKFIEHQFFWAAVVEQFIKRKNVILTGLGPSAETKVPKT